MMIIRPGYTIRDYFDGKRIYHFNPFLFIIVLGGVALFLFETSHVKLVNEALNLDSIASYNPVLAHKFFLLPTLIFIFLFTITDFIFYRHEKFIIPELIVSNIFQAGFILAFVIIIFPLLYIQQIIEFRYGWHIILRPIIKCLMGAYLFYVRYQLYDAKNKPWIMVSIALQIIMIFFIYDFVLAPFFGHYFLK